jgi:nucleotide-binding universal stress UspA family protein
MPTDHDDKKSSAIRHRIIVGADGSEPSLRAVGWAARQAQLTGTPLEIVMAFGPDYVYVDRDEAQEYMQKDLDEAMRHAEAVAPGLEVTTKIFDRLPAIPLIEESKEARLLVVGSRGRGGFASLLLGSVSRKCVHLANCPVVVVGGRTTGGAHDSEATPGDDAPHRIVVGIDGSPASIAAAHWAAKEAHFTGADLEVLTTWEWPQNYGWSIYPSEYDPERDGQVILDEVTGPIRAAHPDLTINTTVAEGHPAERLVQASEGADLLAVGSRGRGEFVGLLLGSVSEHCLTHSHCPVLVARDAR